MVWYGILEFNVPLPACPEIGSSYRPIAHMSFFTLLYVTHYLEIQRTTTLLLLSVLTAIFPSEPGLVGTIQNVSILDFTGAQDGGGGAG